jgi:hypothetical protein
MARRLLFFFTGISFLTSKATSSYTYPPIPQLSPNGEVAQHANGIGLHRWRFGGYRRSLDLFPDSAAETARVPSFRVDSQAQRASVSCQTVSMAKKRTKAEKLQRNVKQLARRDDACREKSATNNKDDGVEQA